ncbi:TPA: conjugal transfer protein TraF, partial [Providencia alcalifaciens]
MRLRVMMWVIGILPLTAWSSEVTTHTYVDEPIVGWHWYNEPQPEEDDEPVEETVPVASLSPSDQKKVMQSLTTEALDAAIMQPSPENAAKYMALQRFWLN